MAVKESNKRVYITLDKKLLKRAEELAKTEGKTLSKMISELLEVIV